MTTASDVDINIGFRPRFVIITNMGITYQNSVYSGGELAKFCIAGEHEDNKSIKFTDTGFTVLYNSTMPYPPIASGSGSYMDYIAFK